MILRDQLQRKLEVKEDLQRIVSLVPSQTELLCDLGLKEKIVGVTKFCVHPGNIRKTSTVVGGTKSLHINKIAKLQPDIILCNKEENTPEMVTELEKIAPVHVSDILSFKDALDIIEVYGQLFRKKFEASALIESIIKEKESFELEIKERRRLKVAYFIWRNPWMLAGRATFINSLLEVNGWENIISDPTSRYPEIDLKDLEFLQPDLILLSSEPFPFRDKHAVEITDHYSGAIELVDGEYFSWYGSRLLPAFKYFREFQMKLSISL